MELSNQIKEQLIASIRDSKKEICGYNELNNEPHAITVISIIKAFGQNPCGFIYIEANIPRKVYKPADIVLCDPEVGVLFVEVKGYDITKIDRVIAGTKIIVNKQGRLQEITPWDQARQYMFDAEYEYKKKYYKEPLPCFLYIVSFPNITRDEWITKFGKSTIPGNEIIFKDDLQNIKLLRARLTDRLIRHGESRDNLKPIEIETIDKVKSVFGDSSVLYNQRDCRKIDEDTLGYQIDTFEIMDKYLSREQQELSNLKVDGKPRLIRGVAGSGKTVVLANIVAEYLKSIKRRGIQSELNFENKVETEPKIAIICFNKALVPLIKEKIEISYKSKTGEELIWDNNIIIKNFDNLIYYVLVKNKAVTDKIWSINDINLRSDSLKREWENYKETSIDWNKVIKFDAIFVDEGQDFSENEFGILKDLLKSSEKGNENIIIFYDDAQNVYGRKRPNWSNVGINITPDRSRVMKVCFRNTKPIINLAYNVLLGTCSGEATRVKTRQFADILYLKNSGLIEEKGDIVEIHFAERTGPKPVFNKFENMNDEFEWVIQNIKELIEKENVRPEDILIISHRREYCDRFTEKIKGKIKGVKEIRRTYIEGNKDEFIFQKDCLTISTIHSAKGYDANVVFLIGLNEIEMNDAQYIEKKDWKREAERRALFYVAATRAKYLLYLSGVNEKDDFLLNETEKLQILLEDKNIYKYDFEEE